MTLHTYLQKIISKKNISSHEKEDYITSLTFNTNLITVPNTLFDLSHLLTYIKNLTHTNNTNDCDPFYIIPFISTSTQNNPNNNALQNHYLQAAHFIDLLFQQEKIILHSTQPVSLSNKTYLISSFLIYSPSNPSTYHEYLNSFSYTISQLSNLPSYDLKKLITSIIQMNLYKLLYSNFFSQSSPQKLSTFSINNHQHKTFHLGLIKKTHLSKKNNTPIYTIYYFHIFPRFNSCHSPIQFTFTISTNCFSLSEKTNVISHLCNFQNHTTEVVMLNEIKKIPNFYDKQSISFHKDLYEQSKYNLYCKCISILQKNNTTQIISTSVKKILPILENMDFYTRNLSTPITIAIVYEKNHQKALEITQYYLQHIFHTNLPSIQNKITISPIELNTSYSQYDLIQILQKTNADAFLCLTHINYENETPASDDILDENIQSSLFDINDSQYENLTQDPSNLYDYYYLIKNDLYQKHLASQNALITQGIFIPPQSFPFQTKELDSIALKIKVSLHELLTKYILYHNTIHLQTQSPLPNGQFSAISLYAPKQLISIINFTIQNNTIHIISTSLYQSHHKKLTNLLKEKEFSNWLSSHQIQPEKLLQSIHSFQDFILYDKQENNFLISSRENTYILSDSDYDLRKNLILTHKKYKPSYSQDPSIPPIMKECVNIMPPLLPLYNLSSCSNRQIYIFEIQHETYYFIGNNYKKCTEHPQSPLNKIHCNENNNNLLTVFFHLITQDLVQNGKNSKMTLLEKFTKIHIIN